MKAAEALAAWLGVVGQPKFQVFADVNLQFPIGR